jgi:hypothetical protein
VHLAEANFGIGTLRRRGQRVNPHFVRFQNRQDAPNLRRRGTRNRQKNFVRMPAFDDSSEIVAPAKYRNAMNSLSYFSWVIIDETDRLITIQCAVVADIANNHFSCIASTVD